MDAVPELEAIIPLVDTIMRHFVKKESDVVKVVNGLKRGYLGYYGRSYRPINFQEICVWIQCEFQNKKPRDLERTIEMI